MPAAANPTSWCCSLPRSPPSAGRHIDRPDAAIMDGPLWLHWPKLGLWLLLEGILLALTIEVKEAGSSFRWNPAIPICREQAWSCEFNSESASLPPLPASLLAAICAAVAWPSGGTSLACTAALPAALNCFAFPHDSKSSSHSQHTPCARPAPDLPCPAPCPAACSRWPRAGGPQHGLPGGLLSSVHPFHCPRHDQPEASALQQHAHGKSDRPPASAASNPISSCRGLGYARQAALAAQSRVITPPAAGASTHRPASRCAALPTADPAAQPPNHLFPVVCHHLHLW